MNSSGWAAVVLVLVIVAGGAWWYMSTQSAGAPSATPAGTVDNPPSAPEPKTVTVDYSSAGFFPASITVSRGDTVTFTNSSSGSMWVAADEHPTHMEYDTTSRATHCAAGYAGPVPFDQCAVGATYSFTFDTAGTFEYHNHSAAQFGGVVTVQ